MHKDCAFLTRFRPELTPRNLTLGEVPVPKKEKAADPLPQCNLETTPIITLRQRVCAFSFFGHRHLPGVKIPRCQFRSKPRQECTIFVHPNPFRINT